MDNKIPYQLFGSQTLEKCFFLHGNGFSPKAYHSFLNNLSSHLNIYAMFQRPFWETDLNPNLISGWKIFKNDAKTFLKENNLNNSIGIGHSMGAIIILLIEIESPGTFKKIFLLDPVITSSFKSLLYKQLLKVGLIDRLHPMIRRTNNKKMEYRDKTEIYTNYRRKNIFSKLSDEDLKIYIDSIIVQKSNSIKIKISKDWENAIYRNGSVHDYWIWKNIKKVNTTTYVITPKNNEFGHFNYGKKMRNENNQFLNLTIEETSHLFPLEKPRETADLILSNITF